MGLSNDLLLELRQEAAVTRRYLALVPYANAHFKPHKNSESLGHLALHVAETISWWKAVIEQDELDFIAYKPVEIHTADKLLSFFDQLLQEAETALLNCSDSDFDTLWSMRNGDIVYFTLPKKQVVRTFCMNHLIHHRAQLGVYLRMLDIPVPATYGPSADDQDVLLTRALQ